MKKLFCFLVGSVLLIVLAFVCFYLWAKSPTISAEEAYNRLEYHDEVTPHIVNDSIIRVLTYNIGYLSGMTNNEAVRPSHDFYKKNEAQVLKLLKETNATIVGFQEIDYHSKRSYYLNQHKYIAEKLYPYSLIGVNWDKHYVPFPYYPISVNFGRMLSGQSIMSQYKLSNPKRRVLEKVASQPFYYNHFYLDRLLQIVDVDNPVRPFVFINIHAEAFDYETRAKHIDYAYQKFKEISKTKAVILVGDFNSDPEYRNATCNVFLRDTTIGVAAMDILNPKVAPKTYPADNPKERLDYIFYTPQYFTLEESRILREYGVVSDHLPCYAVLKIKK